MFSIQLIALLIGFLVFSLLLACGRTLRFGKKFHRAVFVISVLENLSFMSAILLLGWQNRTFWRLCLLVTACLVWLIALLWTWRLEQVQKKISVEVCRHQSA